MKHVIEANRIWRARAAAMLLGACLAGLLPGAARGEEVINLAGMQIWNADYWQTTSMGDYMGPNYNIRKLGPISLAGCRNGYFSGHVVVTCSTAPITGLKVTISDLTAEGGKKILAKDVRLRYPDLVKPDNSWCPVQRFDRFADTLPDEIPMVDMRSAGAREASRIDQRPSPSSQPRRPRV